MTNTQFAIKKEDIHVEDIIGNKATVSCVSDGRWMIEKAAFLSLPAVKIFTKLIEEHPTFKKRSYIKTAANDLKKEYEISVKETGETMRAYDSFLLLLIVEIILRLTNGVKIEKLSDEAQETIKWCNDFVKRIDKEE